MPLERLALSPQCGFASTMEGNELSFADQRRKLELVVNVAREVWEAYI
jgi:methionine synthase II (cobalamin-independent)